jgi:hypothetical protein
MRIRLLVALLFVAVTASAAENVVVLRAARMANRRR